MLTNLFGKAFWIVWQNTGAERKPAADMSQIQSYLSVCPDTPVSHGIPRIRWIKIAVRLHS
ncbi:MAG TPA: hypothetical protein VIF10_15165 [Methylobacter sp.]|jgi:hypothetical protein